MSSSSNAAVVGGIAAMDLTHQSSAANHAPTQTHAPSQTHQPKVSVQHIDSVAASASSSHPLESSQGADVTLVATPKTMSWAAIIVLLTLGVVGLVVVLVYSIVKPGSGSDK